MTTIRLRSHASNRRVASTISMTLTCNDLLLLHRKRTIRDLCESRLQGFSCPEGRREISRWRKPPVGMWKKNRPGRAVEGRHFEREYSAAPGRGGILRLTAIRWLSPPANILWAFSPDYPQVPKGAFCRSLNSIEWLHATGKLFLATKFLSSLGTATRELS